MSEERKINMSAVMPDPREPVNVSEIMALAALGRDGQEAAFRALAARTAVLGGQATQGGIIEGDQALDGAEEGISGVEADSFNADM